MATRTAANSPAPAPKRKSTSTPNGSHSPKRGASYLPQVDEYIAAAPAFAQPILHHIRELVHKALPDVEEDIKWSMPFFIYRGLMVGNMAAFKQHCSFGLWGKEAAADLRAVASHTRLAPEYLITRLPKNSCAPA